MVKKLKYIFCDFSDDFKSEFLSLLKKSIWFLIIGVIGMILMRSESVSGFGEIMYALGFIIFGLIWAHKIASTLTIMALCPKNIMIKMVLLIAAYMVCMIIGYIYFVWSTVKIIIIAIINYKKKR